MAGLECQNVWALCMVLTRCSRLALGQQSMLDFASIQQTTIMLKL